MAKREKFAENVAMSPEQRARAEASAAALRQTEAAQEAEDLVRLLAERWEAR